MGLKNPAADNSDRQDEDQEKIVQIYLFQMRGNPIETEDTLELDQL